MLLIFSSLSPFNAQLLFCCVFYIIIIIIIMIIIIIINLLFWEFFPPALADGFSLESKWEVSSNLLEPFQYSDQSQ